MRSVFVGNLGQTPEAFTVNSGETKTQLSLAVTPRTRDRKTGEWSDLGAPVWLQADFWGTDANTVLDYDLQRGQRVVVSGELGRREYQRRDGTPGATMTIERPRLEGFLPPRSAYTPQYGGQQARGAANSGAPMQGCQGGGQNAAQGNWGGSGGVVNNAPAGGSASDPWATQPQQQSQAPSQGQQQTMWDEQPPF
ncbi:Helix-destabilizing protein [Actinobaculum suis]|uniref:Single-stranded DNA-binding protein n=1 Tax=Actinobaculum suis TaxID=1657 RepID=A0A7Z8Y919_9ACTO|nr:single-stranded DNA-binding protein [Actinobaculum suis]VDG76180.1 Helix-destabilizing protein [Actinobaculum suis]